MDKEMIMNLDKIVRSNSIMAKDNPDSIIFSKEYPYYMEVRNLHKKIFDSSLPDNFIAIPTLYSSTDRDFFNGENSELILTPLLDTLHTLDNLPEIKKYIPDIRDRVTTRISLNPMFMNPTRIIDTILYPGIIIIALDNEEQIEAWKTDDMLKSFITLACINFIYDSVYIHNSIESVINNSESGIDAILYSSKINYIKRYHRVYNGCFYDILQALTSNPGKANIFDESIAPEYISKVYCDLSSIDDETLYNFKYYETGGNKFEFIDKIFKAEEIYKSMKSDLENLMAKYCKTSNFETIRWSLENVLDNI